MRSFVYLLLLGLGLLTLALVVRSGIFARRNPGEPINAAMRVALAEQSPQLSSQDVRTIEEEFGTTFSTPSGLMYVNRGPGTGPATPKAGDTALVNYQGRLLDGTPLDSSERRGGPISLKVGYGGTIKGLDEGLTRMTRGSRKTLIIPYWLGYGEAGAPPKVPPRATLVFDVELLDFH